MRILIIEDTAQLATLFSKWVEQEGHSAQIAHTAVEGLRALKTFVPDVLLLDIGLPDMDGWQIARTIRSDDKYSEVKIIVISAFDSQKHCRQSKAVGVDFHLAKPTTRKRLLRLLALLDERRSPLEKASGNVK